MAHLSIRILSREGPRDAAARGIATLLPSRNFSGEQRLGRQTPIEALAVEDANFDLRHIEPAGVVRGVVKDHAPEQPPRYRDAEHFLEADARVGIEVVEDQMDAPRVRLDVFEQVLDEGHEVGFGPVLGHLDGASAALGFYSHDTLQVPARAHS